MSNDEALFEQLREKIQLSVPKKDFRVFVFGPGLDPSEIVEKPTSDISTQTGLIEHAKYLRFLPHRN